jgi:hypothetical protein
METAIIWGVLLVAYIPAAPEMPPITDINYSNMDQCEKVRGEFMQQYPSYQAYCIETWKPDEVKKAKARKKVVAKRRPTRTTTRTATRRR